MNNTPISIVYLEGDIKNIIYVGFCYQITENEKTVTGTVKHIDGDKVWVRWDDSKVTIESRSRLERGNYY